VASAGIEGATFVQGTGNYATRPGFSTFPTSSLTVDFFAQIDAANSDANTLVSYGTTAGNDNSFLVLAQQNNLVVYVNGVASTVSAPALFDHQWHHVAVTYNAATGHSDVYVDGVAAGGSNRSPAAIAAGGTFMLGQEQDSIGGSLDPNQSQIGGIASVNIWSRVLDATEVARAAGGVVALSDPSLVAAYHYNPTSHAFDDASGHGAGMTTVGDLPGRAGPDVVRSAIEQTSLDLKSTGLAISDVDAGATPVTVTLSVTEGQLAVAAGTSGATVSNSGTANVTLTGTVAQINALLSTDAASVVSYIDNSDTPSPSATLTLTVNDNGAAGAGGALSSIDTAIITITAVNDAPVVSGSVTGAATEDGSAVTLGALANASDPDTPVLAIVNIGALPAGVTYDGAAKTFTLDPTHAAYQSLAQGQQTTVTVGYAISDGVAPPAAASVSWTVIGTNDAPQTLDSLQSGTAGAGAVKVSFSGSDVDGSVASFKITDLPANGSLYADAGLTQLLSANSLVAASGNAGSVWFKPNSGFAGSTSFHFASVDNLGLVDATPATATVNIASGAEGVGIAAKASANLAASTVDVSGILGYGTPSLDRINIVYIVDSSGSVSSANFKTEIAGFKALTNSLIAQGVSTIANVTVVQFDTGSINQGNFTLGNVNAKLDSLTYTAGSSYYLSAFTTAYSALAAKPDGWDLIYFASDGTANPSASQDPTNYISQTIGGSGRSVSIETFGYLATSSAGQTALERWDTNHYTNVATTTNLGTTMSQSQIQAGANLGSLTLSVDNGPATSLVGTATYGPLGVNFSAAIHADLTDGIASRVVVSGLVNDAATALDPAVSRTAQTVLYVGDPGLATLFDIDSLDSQPAILRGFDADDRLDLDGALGVTLTAANASQYVSLSAFMDLDQDGVADDRMLYVDPTGSGHFAMAALQLIDPVGVSTVLDLLF
jgi:VCBS repeat-containing protein